MSLFSGGLRCIPNRRLRIKRFNLNICTKRLPLEQQPANKPGTTRRAVTRTAIPAASPRTAGRGYLRPPHSGRRTRRSRRGHRPISPTERAQETAGTLRAPGPCLSSRIYRIDERKASVQEQKLWHLSAAWYHQHSTIKLKELDEYGDRLPRRGRQARQAGCHSIAFGCTRTCCHTPVRGCYGGKIETGIESFRSSAVVSERLQAVCLSLTKDRAVSCSVHITGYHTINMQTCRASRHSHS